jgi:GNAT superfamily N-acetyltransferase
VVLKPASDVAPSTLADFHAAVFPGRAIGASWPWLYRASAGSPFPIVALDGRRVVAHAGGIPFTATLDGRDLRAAWYVDFAVRPEHQRQGLGVRLTEEWMKQSELCVTFCNEKSMGVFRRFGWVESFDTALHTIWLRPFDHPRLRAFVPGGLGRLANRAARPALQVFHRWCGGREPRFEALDAAAVAEVACGGDTTASTVTTRRDADYAAWRLAASPDRAEYRVLRDEGITTIVRVNGAVRPSVDVLWMSPASIAAPRSVQRTIASIALWAARQGRVFVRYYPPDRTLGEALEALRPLVSHPRFAFWARDAALLERLRHVGWRWQLLDSDFEWI